MRVGLLALVLLAVPACEVLVDTSGLAGSAERPSAGATSGDGGATRSPGDAAGAASVAVEGGVTAPFVCGPGELCEDFEGAGTLPWNPLTNGPATLNVDTVKPLHGTKSLHIRKTNGGAKAQSILQGNPPAGALVQSCTYAMWLEPSAGLGGMELFAHYRAPAAADAGYTSWNALSIQYNSTGCAFGEVLFGSAVPGAANDPLPPLDGATGRWVQVVAELDSTSETVTIDGEPTVRALKYAVPASQEQLLLGMNYETDAANVWEIFIDDIHCKRGP